MLQCTTKGLSDSWEGQNISRLERCLSLHLEVIFHPVHRHIWAAFCSYLNQRCFISEHMPKADFVQLSARTSWCRDKWTNTLLCKSRHCWCYWRKHLPDINQDFRKQNTFPRHHTYIPVFTCCFSSTSSFLLQIPASKRNGFLVTPLPSVSLFPGAAGCLLPPAVQCEGRHWAAEVSSEHICLR